LQPLASTSWMFQSFIYLSKRLFNFWANTYFMSQFFFVATSILDVSQFVKMLWFMSLFWLQSWVCFFSSVTSAFQCFTCKLCLQFSGLRMCNFTWDRLPIKNLLIDSLLTPIVESTYLNRDMCKLESLQKDESRWHSTDSSKAHRNTSAFKCLINYQPSRDGDQLLEYKCATF